MRESLLINDVSLQFQSGLCVIFIQLWHLELTLCSFLDQVERIAAQGYEPSTDDVLKARIQTMGVEEHILKLESSTCISLLLLSMPSLRY